jgi:hypothetical protein
MKQATLTGIPAQPLSFTETRKVLGELPGTTFERPQPVRIQRGNRIVRLVPKVIPEDALRVSNERTAGLNGISTY